MVATFVVGGPEKRSDCEQYEERVRHNEANRETLDHPPIIVAHAGILCDLALQKALLLPGGLVGIIVKNWAALSDMKRALKTVVPVRDAIGGITPESWVRLENGCIVSLHAATGIESIRGNGFDYLYVFDVELSDYAKNEVIYPALSDSSGSIRRVQTV